MRLQWIDYLIILIYFGFVLGIGFVLKRYAKTSTDFFLLGPIDPGLDHRDWRSSPPTSAPRK
jgi:SSS family solute:Na+ symporter